MSDAPPPYPGIIGFSPNVNPGAPNANPGFAGAPGFQSNPAGNPGFNPGYPNQPPPSYSGYPAAQGGGGSSYPTLPQQPFGFNAPSAPSKLKIMKNP